jgi:hypothetical protein
MKRDKVIHGSEVVAVSLVRLSDCIHQKTFNNEANLETNPFRCAIARVKPGANTAAATPYGRLTAKTSPEQCHKADKSPGFATLSHLLDAVFAAIALTVGFLFPGGPLLAFNGIFVIYLLPPS